MNKLTAPRPLLVDAPSDSGFVTTSWGEQAARGFAPLRPRGGWRCWFMVPRQGSDRRATCIARMMRSS
jgi:hypothetical protein